MKIYITIIIFNLSFSIFSQEMDAIKNNEIEQFAKHLYEKSSYIFKKVDIVPKENKDFLFPWLKEFPSKDNLKKYLKILKENSTLEINSSIGTVQLQISSYLSEDENKDIFKLLDFVIIKSDLTNQENEKIKVGDYIGSSWGYDQKCHSKKIQTNSSLCKTISSSFKLDVSKEDKIAGELIVKARFISGYAYKEVTMNDINKPIILNDSEFKIINIINNTVVISQENSRSELLDGIGYFNINKNGYRVESIGSSTICTYNYNLFKENPNLSLQDYSKKIHHKLLKIENSDIPDDTYKKEFGENYTILISTDRIEKFILYVPNYEEMEFVVQLQ
ncbi:hypothetical protein [uncultured Maribacter sp.]|uniref:hypothetical protein n=1 Tax=uncultured Maribacter sp. TaxID=431308 RepID=UPI0026018ABF|nr:hypothetical protein [uncultured Maribacter sp.]